MSLLLFLLPVIVLVLAKVAGEKYRAGQKPVALALPMSIGIDCGLVACELALISDQRR